MSPGSSCYSMSVIMTSDGTKPVSPRTILSCVCNWFSRTVFGQQRKSNLALLETSDSVWNMWHSVLKHLEPFSLRLLNIKREAEWRVLLPSIKAMQLLYMTDSKFVYRLKAFMLVDNEESFIEYTNDWLNCTGLCQNLHLLLFVEVFATLKTTKNRREPKQLCHSISAFWYPDILASLGCLA